MGIGVAARDDEDNEERVEDDEVSAHRRIIPTAWFMGLTLIPLQLRIMYIMSSCVPALDGVGGLSSQDTCRLPPKARARRSFTCDELGARPMHCGPAGAGL